MSEGRREESGKRERNRVRKRGIKGETERERYREIERGRREKDRRMSKLWY